MTEPTATPGTTDTGEVQLRLRGWRLVDVELGGATAPRWAISDPVAGVSQLGLLRADLSGIELIADLDLPGARCTADPPYLICGGGAGANAGAGPHDWALWHVRP